MATEYPDLYIRSTLNDPGTVPRSTSGISSSPDVIPFGLMPAADPVKYFTDNFNKDLGVNVTANTANYLYLRGRNQYNGARAGKAYLYFAKSSLLLYPKEWRENILYTSNQQGYIDVAAAKKNDVWVTPEPFRWIPEMPGSNYHYCLIGRVATVDNPNEIPAIGSIPDFAAWIAANGGLGWRNVTTVDAGVTFTREQTYSQGDTGDQMEVNLICNGAPIGAEVWFTSGTNLPDGAPITIPVSKITKEDGKTQIFGTSAFIPAGWRTSFSFSYKANGGKPYPNFDISLRVNYATTAMSALYDNAWTLEELGYEEMLVWNREQKKFYEARDFYKKCGKTAGDGPVKLVVVGADSAWTQR